LFIQNNPEYNIYFLIIIIIFVYYIIYNFLKKILDYNEKYFKIIIVIISIIIYTIWNIIVKTQPVSDYEVLIKGAKAIVDGTFKKLSFDPSNYFYFYNFQVGYTLYLSIIMKIFGKTLLSLKIIEVLVLSFSNLLVYLITSKIYNKKIGVIASMIYGSLLFNIAGSSIINNQHISMLTNLLSLYFLVKNDKIFSKNISGMFLGLSYILRASSIIFVIAIICFYIWKILINHSKDLKKNILSILIIFLAFFSFVKAFDFTCQKTNIVPNSVTTGNLKYFKFVLGIQWDGITGSITKDAEKTQIYYDLEKYNFDYDKYNKDSKAYLINKYKNETKLITEIIYNKIIFFTSEKDNQIGFAQTGNININIIQFINYYGYTQYILIIILSLISSLLFLKNKNNTKSKDNFDILLKITFIGYFLCHIFIEVQTRYRFDQYMLLSILSANTLYNMFNIIKNRHNI